MTLPSIKLVLFGIAFIALTACSSEPHNHSIDKSENPQVETDDDAASSPVASNDADSSLAGEQAADAGTIRSADAHSHGVANLAVVIEGQSVFIELESPLYNILGFEHVPQNEQQKQIVLNARNALTKTDGLFAFNRAGNCALIESSTLPEFFDRDHGHHHGENHSDEEHGEHKDIIISYEYTCKKPEALSEVTINLFDSFEALSELDVTILGPNMQKQITLFPENTKIIF